MTILSRQGTRESTLQTDYPSLLLLFATLPIKEHITTVFGGFTHLVRQLVLTGSLGLKETDKKRWKPQSLMHIKSIFHTGASHVWGKR